MKLLWTVLARVALGSRWGPRGYSHSQSHSPFTFSLWTLAICWCERISCQSPVQARSRKLQLKTGNYRRASKHDVLPRVLRGGWQRTWKEFKWRAQGQSQQLGTGNNPGARQSKNGQRTRDVAAQRACEKERTSDTRNSTAQPTGLRLSERCQREVIPTGGDRFCEFIEQAKLLDREVGLLVTWVGDWHEVDTLWVLAWTCVAQKFCTLIWW